MMGADFEDLFKFVDPKVGTFKTPLPSLPSPWQVKNALTRSSNSHAVKVARGATDFDPVVLRFTAQVVLPSNGKKRKAKEDSSG